MTLDEELICPECESTFVGRDFCPDCGEELEEQMVEMTEKDANIMKKFIEENKQLFKKYLKKEGHFR